MLTALHAMNALLINEICEAHSTDPLISHNRTRPHSSCVSAAQLGLFDGQPLAPLKHFVDDKLAPTQSHNHANNVDNGSPDLVGAVGGRGT